MEETGHGLRIKSELSAPVAILVPEDSGSLIVDGVTKRPVALLFAGGGNTTFGNPIEPVLSRFQVEIL